MKLHICIKRLISFALSVFLALAVFMSTASAKDYSGDVVSKNVCVYNLEYSTPIYLKNADGLIAPGPTAKIMTGILAIEYFSENYDRTVKVSAAALKDIYGSTVIGLSAGEEIPARDLIYAALVAGASDAANALAIEISGSVSSFAAKMTEKASSIGATSTRYYNATGLDAAGAHTTALDTALISAYAYRLPDFLTICNTRMYKIPETSAHAERTIYTRNFLLSTVSESKYLYSQAKGMNAGCTDEAGWCVVSSASDKFAYICVAMGAEKDSSGSIGAYTDAKKLLGWALSGFAAQKIIDTSDVICEIPVSLSSERDYVTAVPSREVYAFLPADTDLSEIKRSYELYEKSLSAPVKRGTEVGTLNLSLDGKIIGSCPLVTKLDAEKSPWLSLKAAMLKILGSKVSVISVVLLIVFCVLIAFVRIYILMKKAKPKI